MSSRVRHRLDPRLARLGNVRSKQPQPRRQQAGEEPHETARTADFEPVFIEVAHATAAASLEKQPYIEGMIHLVDGYYTALVRRDSFETVATADGVIEIEGARHMHPHLLHSLPSIDAHSSTLPAGWPGEGHGVVIGIVDYGLNLALEDFQNPTSGDVRDARNPNGRTRVAYFWDHNLKQDDGERVPEKYGYGVEYNHEEIDAALERDKGAHMLRAFSAREDELPEKALRGHGTHVTGIAAGNGRSGDAGAERGNYAGVAPAATIVFVNLNRKEAVNQTLSAGGSLGNSVAIAHAVTYCFEKAESMGMPCVVNLSLGSNGGGHDGNLALEWIMDALLQKSGRAVVVAAGNEEDESIHATGTLCAGGEKELEWIVGDPDAGKNDPNQNEMEIWYARGNALAVTLVDPDGNESPAYEPDPASPAKPCRLGTSEVSVDSASDTAWKGDARIHLLLAPHDSKHGIRNGTWRVRLKALCVASDAPRGQVRFDAWIERTMPVPKDPNERSRFAPKHANPDAAISVTPPGTGFRTITVGSCVVTANGRVWASAFSGRGPTRDMRQKPDVVAPGADVYSTNARFGQPGQPARVSMVGTSMAAPHVTGIVARMFARNAYLTAREVREILTSTATPPQRREAWDPQGGYGRVDAAAAVQRVSELSGTRDRT